MTRLRLLCLILGLGVAATAAAGESLCNDPETAQRWVQARARYPTDATIVALASKRETLCDLVARHEIGEARARELWEGAIDRGGPGSRADLAGNRRKGVRSSNCSRSSPSDRADRANVVGGDP